MIDTVKTFSNISLDYTNLSQEACCASVNEWNTAADAQTIDVTTSI